MASLLGIVIMIWGYMLHIGVLAAKRMGDDPGGQVLHEGILGPNHMSTSLEQKQESWNMTVLQLIPKHSMMAI